MSKNGNTGANPFGSSFNSWSTYNYSFQIPETWNEDSNYLLEFNFGEFGYRASNTLGATAEQKIYVDNIRLASEEADIVTLLVDNKTDSSSISAHSSNSSAWIKNYVSWPETNSKPNFDYINGMLKISDANFRNRNSNKFIYFSNKSKNGSSVIQGWKYKESAIPEAPDVFVQETSIDEEHSQTFPGHDYLNLYFSNQHFATEPDSGEQTGQWANNWNLDEFGTSNIYRSQNDNESHGLTVRLHRDERAYHHKNAESGSYYATANGGFGYATWNNEENLGTITRAVEHINKDKENYEIPITRWQANAVVYYLKAKIAEDMKDMEGREYYMRLFKIQLEKSSSAKKHGTHIAQGHWNMLS